jgi:transposase, IS5 family
MRIRIKMQQCFFINVFDQPAVAKQAHEKYNRIDNILQTNPEILNAVHSDLKTYGDSEKRRSAFSTEQVLRMLIVRCIEQLSYRDLIIRVNESDFLRNFTLLGMGRIMSFGFINSASKLIQEKTWRKINDILSISAKDNGVISGEKLRVDSTVCSSNIHYPTDSSLLWDSYRVLSRLMRQAVSSDTKCDCGYRFHDKKIKKLHTFISTSGGRKNKSTKRKVKADVKILVEKIEEMVSKSKVFIDAAKNKSAISITCSALCEKIEMLIPKVEHIALQARRSQINGETVPASERIFSIFEDHTELLKRGKVQSPIEFGHLITIAQTAQKFITYYSVEKKSRHDTEYKDEVIEDHHKRFEVYPSTFAADKNYYKGMDDVTEWEKKIENFGVAKKGNRTQEEIDREHSDAFRASQQFRAGCEGSISVLKRAFGLQRCFSRGFKSFAASIGCIVFCHNIVKWAET